MKTALQILRWLFPVRWLLLALLALAASGWALHRMERFAGLAWGLTEMGHIWVGWASVLLWCGYLGHHVWTRWGAWRSVQRGLGLALTLASTLVLVSGGMLALGMRGGPPSWALPAHFGASFVLGGLLAAHTFVAWRRWPRRVWRRVIDGPRPVPNR
jgi:hypothetical protein